MSDYLGRPSRRGVSRNDIVCDYLFEYDVAPRVGA